ncbi:MAG: ABC transporter ATP-binding protein/permease [Lachnospiraceae bacterium]|nr:ABC transporter ATP-binding protein/permease [Lachnospiraceae bacterium]
MTERQYFFRMFTYAKPYKLGYSLGIFLYCSQQFLFPVMNSIFLGGVTAAILAFNLSGVFEAIFLMVMMLLFVVVVVGIGTYFYIVNVNYIRRDLSIDLFKSFIKANIESQKHSGEGIAALNMDIESSTGVFDDALAPFLQNVLAALVSAPIIFSIDWRMGLGALAIGTLIFFAQSRFARPLARLGKAQLSANADSVKALSNIFSGALTIRAYNRQERSLIQFDHESGKLKKLAFKQALIGMCQDLLGTVQGWLTLVFVFAVGGYMVVIGEIEFALVMMIFPLAEAICGAMGQMGASFAGLHPPLVAAKRLFDVIDQAKLASNSGNELSPASAKWNKKYKIELTNLNFSYKDAERKALDGLTLSIAENKMVAFVGESGSGKSTLLRVIIGMYERDFPAMGIGDLAFNQSDLKEWRSHFAYVDQSCKLFNMSIAENISLGFNGKATDEQIKEAAKRAFAHDFIMELADGYQTSCGENGASLSGGQKQRLAIARALCRKAPVLVFDEATSALDPESERGIMETIAELKSDHTVLITTHNLNNIIGADMIVVMDGGRIGECGTHDELLLKGGIYVKLFESKSQSRALNPRV